VYVRWRHFQNPTDVTTNTQVAVNINVYAWVTEFEMGAPYAQSGVKKIAKAKAPVEAHEYRADRPVSTTLSAISSAANVVSKIPVIGAFASTVSSVAGMAASVADFFGFSRPVDLRDPHRMVLSNSYLAATSGLDQTDVLTLDLKCGRALDSEAISGDSCDILSFPYLLTRWSFVKQFTFATTDAAGATLLQFGVNPTSAPTSTNFWMLSPLSHAALCFARWRGSMEYKLEITCSQFHRGRLRMFWSNAFTPTEPVGNTTAVTYIDLSPGLDVVFTVPWASNYPYLPTFLRDSSVTGLAGVENGALIIQVDQPLQSVNASASVTLYLSMRGGPDFELQEPTMATIGDAKYNAFANQTYQDWPTASYATPASGYLTPAAQSGSVAIPPALGQLSAHVFGERIQSFRELVRRYSPSGCYKLQTPGATTTFDVLRVPRVDPVPGVGSAAGSYYPAMMSWLTWVNICYGFNVGSVRKRILLPTTNRTDYLVVRSYGVPGYQTVGATLTGNEVFSDTFVKSRNLGNGAAIAATHNQNSGYGFTIPDYNGFAANHMGKALGMSVNETCADILIGDLDASTSSRIIGATVLSAAGDDYNVACYFGPPVVYFWGPAAPA